MNHQDPLKLRFFLEIRETPLRWKVRSTHYVDPGEQLVVCRNASLVESRQHKRNSLLEATKKTFHREEDMVIAHVFMCMLACHLRWHMDQKLKPIFFNDEVPGGEPRKNPVL